MSKRSRGAYYAVRVGKEPGVYTSWEECKLHVLGYPAAVYKKFDTFEEAETFVGGAKFPETFKLQRRSTEAFSRLPSASLPPSSESSSLSSSSALSSSSLASANSLSSSSSSFSSSSSSSVLLSRPPSSRATLSSSPSLASSGPAALRATTSVSALASTRIPSSARMASSSSSSARFPPSSNSSPAPASASASAPASASASASASAPLDVDLFGEVEEADLLLVESQVTSNYLSSSTLTSMDGSTDGSISRNSSTGAVISSSGGGNGVASSALSQSPLLPAAPQSDISDSEEYVMYTDGASRQNPGPAGIGVVIQDRTGKTVAEVSEFIGKRTNNEAEYAAFIRGMDRAYEIGIRRIRVKMDSQLLCKQFQGFYEVKQPHLRVLMDLIQARRAKFRSVKVEHVRREFNTEADALANAGIDMYGASCSSWHLVTGEKE